MEEYNREKISKLFKKILENKELSGEMEKVSPGITSQMAGCVMSSWLPIGATRKVIMVVITLVAIIGAIFFNKYLLFLLLVLPIFSPRITAEITLFLGTLINKQREAKRKNKTN